MSEIMPRISIPEPVLFCMDRLSACRKQAFVVGGAVRDALLGKEAKDFDIATDATPEEMLEIFADQSVHPTGLSHGTITVVKDDEPIEITTFRTDGDYSDGRHPDQVTFCESVEEDVQRRDLTMNGLAADRNGVIHDFVGGVADLRAKRVRCIGDGNRRFGEDGLRILRALRFASVLDFAIEESTAEAILGQKELLRRISAERIWKELGLFLIGVRASALLLDFIEVFGVVIPELLPMRGFEQRTPYHCYDVLTHSAVVLANVPPREELRLAALFHDIGKPDCFFVGEDGIGHFYGHPKRSAEIADAVLRRLKADNQTREHVVDLVLEHDVEMYALKPLLRKRLSRFGEPFLRDLLLLKKADNLGQSELVVCRREEIAEMFVLLDELLAEEGVMSLKCLAISGADVMALGIPAGRKVGELLQLALDQVIEGEWVNEKEALLAQLQKWIEREH